MNILSLKRNASRAILGCLLIACCAARPSWADEQPATEITRERLDDIIVRLEDDATRMEALRDLLAFARTRLMMTSSVSGPSQGEEKDRLTAEAFKLVLKQWDAKTVKRALSGTDTTLQWWALRSADIDPDRMREWKPILPDLKRFALDDNPNVRNLALEKLWWFPQSRAFLERRKREETSLTVLMGLMRGSRGGEEYEQELCNRVFCMLNSNEQELRSEAMRFIAGDSRRAEMWQFPYGYDILERVIELGQQGSDSDRSLAACALLELRHLAPDRCRQELFRLAKDLGNGNRWLVAWEFRHEMDRDDVHALLHDLLNDPDVDVRCWTMRALGVPKHLDGLREIADGPDAQYAKFAAKDVKPYVEPVLQPVPTGDAPVVVNSQVSLVRLFGQGFDNEWTSPTFLLPKAFDELTYVSGPGDLGSTPKGDWRRSTLFEHGDSGAKISINCYNRRQEPVASVDSGGPTTPFLPQTEPNYRFTLLEGHYLTAAVAGDETRDVLAMLDNYTLYKITVSGVTSEQRQKWCVTVAEAIWRFRYRPQEDARD